MPALGFAFLQNTLDGKTKAYGKYGFWELLLSFKAQVGPVFVITCVGDVLILKLCLSVLLCSIKLRLHIRGCSKLMMMNMMTILITTIDPDMSRLIRGVGGLTMFIA